jgi:hypothetical protein
MVFDASEDVSIASAGAFPADNSIVTTKRIFPFSGCCIPLYRAYKNNTLTIVYRPLVICQQSWRRVSPLSYVSLKNLFSSRQCSNFVQLPLVLLSRIVLLYRSF